MKTSIALTTYNGSRYIIELLESLKGQTRKPDELVIVDDASTDDTVAVVNDYIHKYGLESWKLIKNENNIGWKKNFRKVMALCTGDIIFFCDQDDIWHKDKLEVMCGVIEQNSNVKVLVSNYVLLVQGGKQKKGQKGSEKDDGELKKIQGQKRIGTISRPGCTYAFTKEIAELMGRFDKLECSHDHVVYNLGLITDSLYIINRQLIDFRRHTNNASTYKLKFGKERKVLETKERVNVCNILLDYCADNNIEKKKDVLFRRRFYSERLNVYESGNLMRMIKFAIINIRQYWSAREIVVDLIAMVK